MSGKETHLAAVVSQTQANVTLVEYAPKPYSGFWAPNYPTILVNPIDTQIRIDCPCAVAQESPRY